MNKTVNLFEVIFPLTKKGKGTDQIPHKYRTSTTQAPHKSDVLRFCAEPHSLKEIMEHLGLKHRAHVLEEYIQPLVAEELLAATIPDKPKSPHQKYMTTEKGRGSLAPS